MRLCLQRGVCSYTLSAKIMHLSHRLEVGPHLEGVSFEFLAARVLVHLGLVRGLEEGQRIAGFR